MRECKRRWKDAFTAWSFAAEKPPPQAKADGPVPSNLSATEMIYYYHAHIPESI
jgi:hypothetical protein